MEVREADGMRLHRLGPAEDGGRWRGIKENVSLCKACMAR